MEIELVPRTPEERAEYLGQKYAESLARIADLERALIELARGDVFFAVDTKVLWDMRDAKNAHTTLDGTDAGIIAAALEVTGGAS